jgi:hypothetical protein
MGFRGVKPNSTIASSKHEEIQSIYTVALGRQWLKAIPRTVDMST